MYSTEVVKGEGAINEYDVVVSRVSEASEESTRKRDNSIKVMGGPGYPSQPGA